MVSSADQEAAGGWGNDLMSIPQKQDSVQEQIVHAESCSPHKDIDKTTVSENDLPNLWLHHSKRMQLINFKKC